MLRTRAVAIGVESGTALAPARPSLGLVVDDSNKCSVSWKTENGTFKRCAIPLPHSFTLPRREATDCAILPKKQHM